MTGQQDFTEEEWKTVLEGPTSAGMIVITSDRGGTVRETFSMAGAYGEARKKRGQSELLDTLVTAKPAVDRERAESTKEMKENNLENIREAVALVESKATPEEVEEYRRFIVDLAQHVAEVKGVSDKERAAVAEITETVGTDPPDPGA
jgi:hypothetical protein